MPYAYIHIVSARIKIASQPTKPFFSCIGRYLTFSQQKECATYVSHATSIVICILSQKCSFYPHFLQIVWSPNILNQENHSSLIRSRIPTIVALRLKKWYLKLLVLYYPTTICPIKSSSPLSSSTISYSDCYRASLLVIVTSINLLLFCNTYLSIKS